MDGSEPSALRLGLWVPSVWMVTPSHYQGLPPRINMVEKSWCWAGGFGVVSPDLIGDVTMAAASGRNTTCIRRSTCCLMMSIIASAVRSRMLISSCCEYPAVSKAAAASCRRAHNGVTPDSSSVFSSRSRGRKVFVISPEFSGTTFVQRSGKLGLPMVLGEPMTRCGGHILVRQVRVVGHGE